MRSIIRLIYTSFILVLLTLTLIGCDDATTSPDEPDGPSEEPQIELTAEEAAQMLYDYLIESGMIPSGDSQSKELVHQAQQIEGDKFIEVGETDSGDIVLRLYFDENGRIIPNDEWFLENPNVCGDQSRLNQSSARMLEIEIDLTAEVMRMELTNTGTNETIKTHQSEIFVEDDWFIEMIEEMFLEFDDDEILGIFETECGLFDGPITIHFDSEVEAEVITPDITVFTNSAVTAVIELEYFEESEVYAGEAVLSHKSYDNTLLSDFDCSVSLSDAVMRVEVDVENFTSISDLNLYITDPTRGDQAPSASLNCGDGMGAMEFVSTIWFPVYVILHQDYIAVDREGFVYQNWEESNDSNVIGVLEFEHSADFTEFDDSFDGAETMPVSENTTIEIRPSL